jgi:hypothetical protein
MGLPMNKLAKYLTSILPAIVVITNQNTLEWTVLGETSQEPPQLKINLTQAIADLTQKVNLSKQDDKIKLEVTTGETKKEVDVTELAEDVIEIEQSQEAKKVKIGSVGDKFIISQNDTDALTSFPISINPNGKHVTVDTPTGQKYLGIFPDDVFDTLSKTGVLDNLEGNIELAEGEQGQLEYILNGEKVLNLFNLLNVTAPVNVKVSALDGQVLETDSPAWYKVLGFIWK